MAAYTFKWYWKCFKAVGTYFQVVWECVNISTFWRLVLKGPSYSIGLDINFPLIYSACVHVSVLYGHRIFENGWLGFNGSRRNIGRKMEDVERRLLIISSLGKKFLNSLFQDMPNTRNHNILLKNGFPSAPGHSLPFPHSSTLVLYKTGVQSGQDPHALERIRPSRCVV